MQAIEERVCDQAVLALIRMLLRAGVMEGGSLRRSASGTPQGGPLSPLLCNVYLHRLDRAWSAGEHGVLVRYADDAMVMCDDQGAGRGRAGAADRSCWPGSGWSPRRPRPASCTWPRGTRGLISSGFTTGWCAGGPRNRRT